MRTRLGAILQDFCLHRPSAFSEESARHLLYRNSNRICACTCFDVIAVFISEWTREQRRVWKVHRVESQPSTISISVPDHSFAIRAATPNKGCHVNRLSRSEPREEDTLWHRRTSFHCLLVQLDHSAQARPTESFVLLGISEVVEGLTQSRVPLFSTEVVIVPISETVLCPANCTCGLWDASFGL